MAGFSFRVKAMSNPQNKHAAFRNLLGLLPGSNDKKVYCGERESTLPNVAMLLLLWRRGGALKML
jgi:hypothetical protein